MADGSDAIADWPILNALLNVAAGATWVSVHHGGGVGIGNSIHAGMVVVADGTADADERLERVLAADPGTGVIRHADAGYAEAIEHAERTGSSCRREAAAHDRGGEARADRRRARPAGDGWFVLNATAALVAARALRCLVQFEGEPEFPQVGVNVHVLWPGEPNGMYHGENAQEDFLVVSGECVLLIEGKERQLKAWDFVHCPAETEHVFVGAGTGRA